MIYSPVSDFPLQKLHADASEKQTDADEGRKHSNSPLPLNSIIVHPVSM
jgi:hypothetical protein